MEKKSVMRKPIYANSHNVIQFVACIKKKNETKSEKKSRK